MICDNTGFHRRSNLEKNSEIKMIKERTFIVLFEIFLKKKQKFLNLK